MSVRILLAVGLVMIPFLSGTGQSRLDIPQLSVTGSAEIKVKPDEVELYVSVENRHEKLEEAKQQNDERISKVLQFLKDRGVKDQHIQTDFLVIKPVYETRGGIDPNTGLPVPGFDKNKSNVVPAYYQVGKGVEIKLTDLSRFDTVLSGLITNGVNHVQQIDFRTSQLSMYKDKLRSMAAQNAKQKAEAMASELGVTLGNPFSISVNDAYSNDGHRRGGGGGGGWNSSVGVLGEGDATFAAGQITISASVYVVFLIQ